MFGMIAAVGMSNLQVLKQLLMYHHNLSGEHFMQRIIWSGILEPPLLLKPRPTQNIHPANKYLVDGDTKSSWLQGPYNLKYKQKHKSPKTVNYKKTVFIIYL